jgi:TolB protein
MNADGTNQRQLTNDITGSFSPAWSPGGKYIIFLSNRDGVLSNRGNPAPEVYLMNPDGSEQRRVTNNQDFERFLSWSSKGDVIAISANIQTTLGYDIEQIYLMGLDGVIQKQLTETGYNEHPSWSPSGEFIAFVSTKGNETGICIMRVDGSHQGYVTKSVNTSSSSLYVNNLSPSWSPDGNYIVFSSNRDGDYDLYMIKVDGSGLTRLTNEPGDETFPVWSPVP